MRSRTLAILIQDHYGKDFAKPGCDYPLTNTQQVTLRETAMKRDLKKNSHPNTFRLISLQLVVKTSDFACYSHVS